MARKSLIAVPLWAVRYHNKPVRFQTITAIIENTRILHYQVFSGHMPASHLSNCYFRVHFVFKNESIRVMFKSSGFSKDCFTVTFFMVRIIGA